MVVESMLNKELGVGVDDDLGKTGIAWASSTIHIHTIHIHLVTKRIVILTNVSLLKQSDYYCRHSKANKSKVNDKAQLTGL